MNARRDKNNFGLARTLVALSTFSALGMGLEPRNTIPRIKNKTLKKYEHRDNSIKRSVGQVQIISQEFRIELPAEGLAAFFPL